MNFKIALAQIDCRLTDLKANLQAHLELAAAAKQRKAQLIVFPELSLTGYHLQEEKYFARGSRLAAFENAFSRCGILICEENWHPSAAHLLWIDGAKIFFSMHCSSAGNADPKHSPVATPSSSPGACRLLSQFYARMFGAYFIFVNRVGHEGPFHFGGGSQIVNPFGETEATARCGEPDLLIHSLDLGKIREARLNMPLRRDEDIALTLRELSRVTQTASLGRL